MSSRSSERTKWFKFGKNAENQFSQGSSKIQPCVGLPMLHFTLPGVCIIISKLSFSWGLQNAISSKEKKIIFHIMTEKMSVYIYSIIIFVVYNVTFWEDSSKNMTLEMWRTFFFWTLYLFYKPLSHKLGEE